MKINEYPVVILAAGSGTRIQEVGMMNKTLLPIYKQNTIFDILIYKLIKAKVKDCRI
jgi:dTDP-glucose pyrophosphorylase